MSTANVIGVSLGDIWIPATTKHGWLLQGLTGWMDLSESKAEIKERPQTHGAFDPGTDWRQSLAPGLKIAWVGDIQQELDQAIDQLKALGSLGHLINLGVETTNDIRTRPVSIRNIDVPDTRGRSSVDGIAVDVVAPDPRAYGVVSSDSTGLPVHGGGLVFDTSPSTRWNGTPNASASTLSQDGAVVATQYMPNPAWQSSGTPLTRILDGSITYRWANVNAFALSPNGTATYGPYAEQKLAGLPAGSSMALYMEVGGGDSGTARGNILSVTDSGDNILTQLPILVPNRINTLSFTVPGNGQIILKFRGMLEHTVVFYDMLLCASADWSAMQARGVTWFDGDSYPGHLLFPVGFGSPGSDGRARFANTGTAPASVTMTVVGGGSEGITLKRVENGAVLTLSRPCNPDDRIIFDSSDGSVLLNGQAELSGWMTADDYDQFDVEAGDTCTVQLGVMGEIVGVPRLTVSAAPAYW